MFHCTYSFEDTLYSLRLLFSYKNIFYYLIKIKHFVNPHSDVHSDYLKHKKIYLQLVTCTFHEIFDA